MSDAVARLRVAEKRMNEVGEADCGCETCTRLRASAEEEYLDAEEEVERLDRAPFVDEGAVG